MVLSPLQEKQESDERILTKLIMEKFNERDDSKYPRNPQILYKTSKYPQQMDSVSDRDFKRINSEKKWTCVRRNKDLLEIFQLLRLYNKPRID